jgi:hypothetical protein
MFSNSLVSTCKIPPLFQGGSFILQEIFVQINYYFGNPRVSHLVNNRLQFWYIPLNKRPMNHIRFRHSMYLFEFEQDPRIFRMEKGIYPRVLRASSFIQEGTCDHTWVVRSRPWLASVNRKCHFRFYFYISF